MICMPFRVSAPETPSISRPRSANGPSAIACSIMLASSLVQLAAIRRSLATMQATGRAGNMPVLSAPPPVEISPAANPGRNQPRALRNGCESQGRVIVTVQYCSEKERSRDATGLLVASSASCLTFTTGAIRCRTAGSTWSEPGVSTTPPRIACGGSIISLAVITGRLIRPGAICPRPGRAEGRPVVMKRTQGLAISG